MSFAYDADVPPEFAVSLTMPPRVASYNQHYGLLPAFDTNIPEGYLKDVIHKYLAKSRGRVTDLDILEMVGGNMIGRVRVLPEGATPERRDCIPDLGAILGRKAEAALVTEVMERYGLRSGVSGAMPKALLDEADDISERRKTIQTREYILKFDAADFPGLSLNEYWCLEAARAAGNRTAEARLGENGDMIAVRRFDARPDGSRLGFEDAAALNGLCSRDKYGTSMETSVIRNLKPWFGRDALTEMTALYRSLLTSIALRNGDAHLKNFGVLYEDPTQSARLSPVYDVVTTTVYIRNDMMAMTLGGSTRWPKPKALEALGARAGLTRPETARIIEEVSEGIRRTLPSMVSAFDRHGLPDLGRAIAAQWNEGLRLSLGKQPMTIPAPDPFAGASPPEPEALDTPSPG